MANELEEPYSRLLIRHFRTSFEEEVPVLLKFLREWLEFEPTIFDLKELYNHLGSSVVLYNREKTIDVLCISSPAYEAVIRFLYYDYGVIESEKDFLRQYRKNKSRLITRLKKEQALRHHWE